MVRPLAGPVARGFLLVAAPLTFASFARRARVMLCASVLAVCGATNASPALAEAALEVPGLRLPRDVVPLAYEPELIVDPDSDRFAGTMSIRVRVDRATSVVWLNAHNLTVTDASASTGAPGSPSMPATIVAGSEQVMGLRFAEPLAVGEALIRLRYTGAIDATGAVGIFRQQDRERWYVYTQFEPVDARRAFPCFDEPDLKATWRLTLVVPARLKAVSNMPVEGERPGAAGWREVRFARTPLLPSYLVAFAVGEFDVRDAGTAGSGHTPISIIAPKGRGDETTYAAKHTGAILVAVEQYFGVPYPFPKLDLIAYPRSTFGGAMENPGLVTYAARNLLARSDEESLSFEQRFMGITAHEIAHMWFGDYVTMTWWDDLWLNEAFASWLASAITAQLRPEWNARAWPSIQRSRAINADRLLSARSIRQPVTDAAEIRAAFDQITYAKGETVLTMFERWLGPQQFRAGVRRYIERHAWGNATAEDFFAALAHSDEAVVPALRSFVERSGVPLLDVSLDCRGAPTLDVAQSRFRPAGAPPGPAERWVFPACFDYGNATTARRQCALVRETRQSIALEGACPRWVVANRDGIGYFLPRLSAPLYAALPGAKRVLAAADYEPLLGDLALLAHNGAVGYPVALAFAARQADNDDLRAARRAFELVDDMPIELVAPAQRALFSAWIRRHFGARAHALGWLPRAGEPRETARLRAIALPMLATRGADAVLARQARELTVRWLGDRRVLPVEIRRQVLRTAARTAGGAAPALFEDLRKAALATTDANERYDLMQALGSFRAPALLDRALALSLDPALPIGESIQPLRHALELAPTRRRALAWMSEHMEALAARAPPTQQGFWPAWSADACTSTERSQFIALFAARADALDAGARTYRQALENIDLCLALRVAQQAPVNAFLLAQSR